MDSYYKGNPMNLEVIKYCYHGVKLRLKIDLVSYPARVEGLGK